MEDGGGSWKYLIVTDVQKSYHQIPLAKESQKYAGIASPFKGLRCYLTAAMGMPGSEVALTELMSLLFGELRQEGVVECLMDDIYIGGNTPEELCKNWDRVLTICQRADIRLGPSKVTIAPKTTKILGWTWNQGVLEIDAHATNRLESCQPPETAQGLRGWIGTYRYMSPAIEKHADYLAPLHEAVGDKSKSDKIHWDKDLKNAFSRAQ